MKEIDFSIALSYDGTSNSISEKFDVYKKQLEKLQGNEVNQDLSSLKKIDDTYIILHDLINIARKDDINWYTKNISKIYKILDTLSINMTKIRKKLNKKEQKIEAFLLKMEPELTDHPLAKSYIISTMQENTSISSAIPKKTFKNLIIYPALSLEKKVTSCINSWINEMLPNTEKLLAYYYDTLSNEDNFGDNLEELGELNEYDLELLELANNFDIERLNLLSSLTLESVDDELLNFFERNPNSFTSSSYSTFKQKMKEVDTETNEPQKEEKQCVLS